ncbi:MAG: (deoxy)nucleoside triphosphate pyrophosphohydrolase [Deltaproteobacteria bacterium]|nr:MAG: (deoxy)nucleoside triphosphate pyrophosphohydrolase [Deltaproteobacteria bacterium]
MLVTAGVVEKEGKVLIARRGDGQHLAGRWEFPGGKVEAGEDGPACLKRELQEEFGVIVEVGEFLGEFHHDYGEKKVVLLAYRARIIQGNPDPREHSEVAWVEKGELLAYDLAEADVPIARLVSSP